MIRAPLPLLLVAAVVAAAGCAHERPRMPLWGEGYASYSWTWNLLGRQHLEAPAIATLEAAFAERAKADPERVFVVAETGVADGGPLWPHQTHRDGRTLDLLVPLRDEEGRPANLSTWPWTLWGYCYRLDREGRVAGLRWEARRPRVAGVELSPCPDVEWLPGASIDFEALAALLLEIDRQARARGSRVRRVILAPEYVPALLATSSGKRFGRLKKAVLRRPVWIRHDEHVHIELAPFRLAEER